LEGIRKAVSLSRHPVVGIGGIQLNNAADVIKAGASGVAVVSAICSAENPYQAAKELIACIHTNRH
jgi:thiamine-phosphate pyrophosphorylase